jgi:hypothetical protein
MSVMEHITVLVFFFTENSRRVIFEELCVWSSTLIEDLEGKLISSTNCAFGGVP